MGSSVPRTRVLRLILAAAAAGALANTAIVASRSVAGPRFEIAFRQEVRAEAVTGRVYVALSRSVDRQSPINQTDPTGAPLFSTPVEGLAPGQPAVIGPDAFGHPLESLRDLPTGDYWAQPFV